MKYERLKEIRAKRSLKQKDVAEALNLSRSTYAGYEIGRSNPDNDTLQKICKYLNISADYLLGNIDIPLSLDDMSLIKDLEKGKSDRDLINEYDLMLGDKPATEDEMKILIKMMKNLLRD